MLIGGKPTVLITHTLTANAKQLIPKCPGMLAISRRSNDAGALITTDKEEIFMPGPDLWDLGIFVEEVLTP